MKRRRSAQKNEGVSIISKFVTKTPALSDGEVSSSEEQKVSIDHDADLVKAKVPASPAKVGMSEKADSDVDEA